MLDSFDIPFKDFPGYKLKIASTLTMSDLSKTLSPFDLTVTEATILLFVEANPGCLQTELGRTLRIASANLTPMVSKLESRGLILREPVDGRSNGLHLTRTARPFAKEVHQVMAEFERQTIAKVPLELRAPFLAALDYLMPE